MILKLSRVLRRPMWVHLTIGRWADRPYHGPFVRQRDASGKYNPVHLPWAWWHLIAFRVVRLNVHAPTTGYRLLAYTRWGYKHFDLVFDRRPYVAVGGVLEPESR